MTPQQVGAMSMWQFFALLSEQAQSEGLSSAEADDLWEYLKSKE
jgi:hypothetical protein